MTMSEIKTEKIVGDNGGIIITETDENGTLVFYSQFEYDVNKYCMTCYHPRSESSSCYREDCECLKNH